MTKREKKLIELGYELEIEEDGAIASKKINVNAEVVIGLWGGKIQHYYVYSYFTQHIRKQDTINNLQQAFNEMQRDLEILKGIEDDKKN